MARRRESLAIKRDRNPISPRQFPAKNSPTNESLFPRDGGWFGTGEGERRFAKRTRGTEIESRDIFAFPNSASVSITFNVYILRPALVFFAVSVERKGREVRIFSIVFNLSIIIKAVREKLIGWNNNFYTCFVYTWAF